jgi:AcrR family transcriptional regulator
MPVRSPTEARRREILRAAGELLAEQGSAEAITVDQIAERANIAKATLYRHFRSKAEIAEALAAQGVDVAGFQPEERRRRILEAALRAAARWGYRGATMERIGEEAGISGAGIYWYFRSKEELLGAILETYSALPHLRHLLTLPTGDEDQQLHTVLERILDVMETRLDVMKVIVGEAFEHPEVAEEFFQEIRSKLLNRLVEYLDRRVETGIFRPGHSLARAQALIGMLVLYTLIHRALGDGFPVSRAEAVAEFADIFLYGVSRQPRPEARPTGQSSQESSREGGG